jgi:hypothetical protein
MDVKPGDDTADWWYSEEIAREEQIKLEAAWQEVIEAYLRYQKENRMSKFVPGDMVIDEDGDVGRVLHGPDLYGNYVWVCDEANSKGAREGEYYVTHETLLEVHDEKRKDAIFRANLNQVFKEYMARDITYEQFMARLSLYLRVD